MGHACLGVYTFVCGEWGDGVRHGPYIVKYYIYITPHIIWIHIIKIDDRDRARREGKWTC